MIPIIICTALALLIMTKEQRYVALPGMISVLLVYWLWMILWARDRKLPISDVGMICALAVMVYTVLPLLNYWAGGLSFGPLSDFRLRMYGITPTEMGIFHFRHVLYLAIFVFSYALFRGKGIIKTANVNCPNRSPRHVIILIFLLLTGYFWLLQAMTGVNFDTSYQPDAFAEFMSAMAQMPLLLLQVSIKLWGILFIFKLALLFIVVSRSKVTKWRLLLIAWIVVEVAQAFVNRGARTGLILFIMAVALMYHRLVRPLSLKVLVPAGIVTFAIFLFLGMYRSYFNYSEMRTDVLRSNATLLTTTNEFQSLLGTAYDIYQRKQAGADLPWYLFIHDFSAVLPPQQILPFEKVAASEWYLRELGLSGTGLGLMWGVISQSVIGLDWLELAIRGLLLGYLLALLYRWYVKHQTGYLETLLYLYLCLKIYYTFRDTTFSLLANIVWEIIPAYIIFRLGTLMVSRNPSRGMSGKMNFAIPGRDSNSVKER